MQRLEAPPADVASTFSENVTRYYFFLAGMVNMLDVKSTV